MNRKEMNLKIYIASRTRHAARWRELRASGVNIVSTWMDYVGTGVESNLADLVARCVEEVKNSDRFILYCEPGELLRGALIETGAALAAGVPVYLVGTCESISPDFAAHPLWRTADSIEAAIALSVQADGEKPACRNSE